jgi:hypothetical protein
MRQRRVIPDNGPLCRFHSLCSSAHLLSVLLLLRQSRVAAGNCLSTGLSTKMKYVRRSARALQAMASAPRSSSTCDC